MNDSRLCMLFVSENEQKYRFCALENQFAPFAFKIALQINSERTANLAIWRAITKTAICGKPCRSVQSYEVVSQGSSSTLRKRMGGKKKKGGIEEERREKGGENENELKKRMGEKRGGNRKVNILEKMLKHC